MTAVLDFEKLTLLISGPYLNTEHYEFYRIENGLDMRCMLLCRGGGLTAASGTEDFYFKAASLLDECGAASWDGFDGFTDCLDGKGFYLKIELGGGRVISARGSNAFPENFDKFISGIRALYHELKAAGRRYEL